MGEQTSEARTALAVLEGGERFRARLEAAKASIPDVRWYPYGSIAGVSAMKRCLEGHDVPVSSVLDVGPADGDISFLFADAGCEVHAIDHPATNFNDGAAIKRLNEAFGGKVTIEFTDIDLGFALDRQFDLCVMTGVAYHLRNPLLVYMTLARHCRYLITNTKVADVMGGLDVTDVPLAYLLDTREANNDPTNWWIFSPAGYLRALKRSGWSVKGSFCVGAETGGVAGKETNKRMWAFCERVPNYAGLLKHHDY
jgi:tRNA (mo5U34)-methyltransferase